MFQPDTVPYPVSAQALEGKPPIRQCTKLKKQWLLTTEDNGIE